MSLFKSINDLNNQLENIDEAKFEEMKLALSSEDSSVSAEQKLDIIAELLPLLSAVLKFIKFFTGEKTDRIIDIVLSILESQKRK